ncbi:AMP-binding protein [Microbacterium sp. NPDC055910]|uniref:AMP-binding protein n=1 Tax=Microbacterium sp. NPDC055910 TaxID=3345659 RepID=UPI0035D75A7E
MDILDAPEYWASTCPREIAVRDDAGDLTWAELVGAVRVHSAGIRARGVMPGDRVGFLMENSRQFCVSALAILAAGAVAVPINYRLHPREMAEQLDDAGAGLLLHDEAYRDKAGEVASRSGIRLLSATSEEAVAEDIRPRVRRGEDDLAVILYSSGTTGHPKGIAVSHRSIYAMAHDRIVNDGWSRLTRTYVPYPLAFSAGLLASWMATMVAGGMTVVDAAFDSARAIRRFHEDRITVFMSVPALWQAIAEHPDLDGADLGSLSTVSAGGAMVAPELMSRLRSRGILLSQGYGLTESSGVATALRPEDIDRKPGSIGRPMMRMEAKIVGPAGQDLPPGERGELWLRGPAVMDGYWNGHAVDRSVLADGWLATGDVAIMDEDGYLYLVDRLKDMIITGGINVFPAEIERVLGQIPGVGECAVVGVPHERWGETPVAFVVSADSALTPAHLDSELRKVLGGHKIPTQFFVRAQALPRSANGKVLRRTLREEILRAEDARRGRERITALLERYFTAVNSRDWDALRSVLHPDISIRHADLLESHGVDSVVRLYQAILHQYREGEHEDRPTRILIQGDLVAVEIQATVVKLDGTRVEFPAVDMIDIQDGLIRRVSTWYDTARVVPLIKGEKTS